MYIHAVILVKFYYLTLESTKTRLSALGYREILEWYITKMKVLAKISISAGCKICKRLDFGIWRKLCMLKPSQAWGGDCTMLRFPRWGVLVLFQNSQVPTFFFVCPLFNISNNHPPYSSKWTFSCSAFLKQSHFPLFSIDHSGKYHKTLCLSPPPPQKFCISIVSSFSWDLQWSQEKTKPMLMQNLGRQTNSIMVFSEMTNYRYIFLVPV